MQTATATVAGRRRVSFTLPEPAATTFIPRDVESEGRRSTWPPRTERYPEGLRKARAPTRSESEPGPTKTCNVLDLAFADESRAVDADAYEELRLGDDFFDYTAWLFFACAANRATGAGRGRSARGGGRGSSIGSRRRSRRSRCGGESRRRTSLRSFAGARVSLAFVTA